LVIFVVCLVSVIFLTSDQIIADDGAISTPDSGGVIYIVFAIDTEPARISPWIENPVLNFAPFRSSGDNAEVAAVMDNGWRKSYHDSFGGLPRFTWFVLSHEALFHACGGSGTIVYDSLMKFAHEIDRFGDEIGWHYHNADWIDLNHDGKKSWNQITTFDGTAYTDGTDIQIAERSLNALLVRRHFFPTVFRGGWTWENNGLSKWLEDIIPFDFSAYPPSTGNRSIREPLRNAYDWSRAPTSYRGYHPNRSDYQKPGRMRRWIFRTIAPNTRREWNRLFLRAGAGEDQILCFTAHTYDKIHDYIDRFLGRLLHMADSLGVSTRFATASTAAAAIAGSADRVPLRISMNLSDSGIAIRTEGSIFQRAPYCVGVDTAGSITRILSSADGTNRWRIRSVPDGYRELTCAVSNESGESATASITPK
jgi:hypothetical protein